MKDNRKAMHNKPFFDIYLRARENNGSMSPHYHFYHQILLITEGSAKFNIGDRQNKYIAQPGSFMIISAFEKHSFEVLTYPYNGYVLAINNEFASAFLHHPLAFSVFLQRPDNFCHIANLDYSIMLKAQNICIEMEEELIKKDDLWEDNLSFMIMQLLILVYRNSNKPFWPKSSYTVSNLIFQVQKYISQHYKDKICLETLAKEFFVNKFYLSHVFKETTGFSYKDYLIQYRLSIAKDMLINTKMPIAKICEECGYNNLSHFIRIFKAYENLTPAQYRSAYCVKAKTEQSGG